MVDQLVRMLAGQPAVQNVAFQFQRMFTPDKRE
jgi:hypothetical protein